MHSPQVDDYPLKARKWRGRVYANVRLDCSSCPYQLSVGLNEPYTMWDWEYTLCVGRAKDDPNRNEYDLQDEDVYIGVEPFTHVNCIGHLKGQVDIGTKWYEGKPKPIMPHIIVGMVRRM